MDEQADISVDEQADQAVEFTRGLVEAFGAKADVASHLEDEDTVLVDVTGDNLGLLVGPRGATLAAVEELVRTVVQRQTGGHGVRVHVDVGGYREAAGGAVGVRPPARRASPRRGRRAGARTDGRVRPQGRARRGRRGGGCQHDVGGRGATPPSRDPTGLIVGGRCSPRRFAVS